MTFDIAQFAALVHHRTQCLRSSPRIDRSDGSIARAIESLPAHSLDSPVIEYLQRALEAGAGDFEYVDVEALSDLGLELADRMIEEALGDSAHRQSRQAHG